MTRHARKESRMGKYTVVRYGTDTSGRGIYMTRNMHAWLEHVKDRPKIRPFADKLTVVQGAYMEKNGGGATASAGYHDKAGCVDFRTWNLTTDELNKFIVASRLDGGGAWRRDASHGGMDPHCHVTLGGDKVMTSGAALSWSQYLSDDDGLGGTYPGTDYEWRPNPLRYWKWKKAKKRQKINLTVLTTTWGRKGGTSYGKGKTTLRNYAKALHEADCLPHYKYKNADFGRALREGTRRANKKYGITKYTGPNGDRPTWELCRKLGLAPYKVEKKPRTKRIKRVVVKGSASE